MVFSFMAMDTSEIQKACVAQVQGPGKGSASSIDSFKGVLVEVLERVRPKTVLEWGPGNSTEILNSFDSVERIDSVEHSMEWMKKAVERRWSKVNLIFENDKRDYPFIYTGIDKYDLIFVDGRLREECLRYAREWKSHEKTVVILHDAEREIYQEQINKYNNQEWWDDGHTVVLSG